MEEPVKDLALKISFKDPEKYKYGKVLADKKDFHKQIVWDSSMCVSYILYHLDNVTKKT